MRHALGATQDLACNGRKPLHLMFFESCREATIRRFLFTSPGREPGDKETFLKGLILAQNERWRRGLGMQVERIPWG